MGAHDKSRSVIFTQSQSYYQDSSDILIFLTVSVKNITPGFSSAREGCNRDSVYML